jgi:hypothetical protein
MEITSKKKKKSWPKGIPKKGTMSLVKKSSGGARTGAGRKKGRWVARQLVRLAAFAPYCMHTAVTIGSPRSMSKSPAAKKVPVAKAVPKPAAKVAPAPAGFFKAAAAAAPKPAPAAAAPVSPTKAAAAAKASSTEALINRKKGRVPTTSKAVDKIHSVTASPIRRSRR